MTRTDTAVYCYRRGERNRWVTCLVAARIVGGYERGATRDMAARLGLSISGVERLAMAGVTWRELMPYRVRPLRDALTISHFARMGMLMRRHDLTVYDAIEYLTIAAEDRMSVEAMAAAVDAANGGGKVGWGDYWGDVVKSARNLLVASDAPEFVYRIAKLVLKWDNRR